MSSDQTCVRMKRVRDTVVINMREREREREEERKKDGGGKGEQFITEDTRAARTILNTRL